MLILASKNPVWWVQPSPQCAWCPWSKFTGQMTTQKNQDLSNSAVFHWHLNVTFGVENSRALGQNVTRHSLTNTNTNTKSKSGRTRQFCCVLIFHQLTGLTLQSEVPISQEEDIERVISRHLYQFWSAVQTLHPHPLLKSNFWSLRSGRKWQWIGNC